MTPQNSCFAELVTEIAFHSVITVSYILIRGIVTYNIQYIKVALKYHVRNLCTTFSAPLMPLVAEGC